MATPVSSGGISALETPNGITLLGLNSPRQTPLQGHPCVWCITAPSPASPAWLAGKSIPKRGSAPASSVAAGRDVRRS